MAMKFILNQRSPTTRRRYAGPVTVILMRPLDKQEGQKDGSWRISLAARRIQERVHGERVLVLSDMQGRKHWLTDRLDVANEKSGYWDDVVILGRLLRMIRSRPSQAVVRDLRRMARIRDGHHLWVVVMISSSNLAPELAKYGLKLQPGRLIELRVVQRRVGPTQRVQPPRRSDVRRMYRTRLAATDA